MRKQIKLYLTFSFLLWMFTFLGMLLGREYFLLYIISVFVASVMTFYTLHILSGFTNSGLDQYWFKTLEELKEEKEKERKSWEKAEKLVRILGQHESVKLWNAEKEKEKRL